MDGNTIENIKKACLSFFDSSYEQELEKLFDGLVVFLWKLEDNQMEIVYENKSTPNSDAIKQGFFKYWQEKCEGIGGFALQYKGEPMIFLDSDNQNKNLLIACLIHELMHLFLDTKIRIYTIEKMDFVRELFVDYVTDDILSIYNSSLGENNEHESTYLLLDQLVDFPMKDLYSQIREVFKSGDISLIGELISVYDRAAINAYFQDLLDKVYEGDKEVSFRLQYPGYAEECAVEIKKSTDNILQKYINYNKGDNYGNKEI